MIVYPLFFQLFDGFFIILFLKLFIHFFRNGRVICIGRVKGFLFEKHMVQEGQHHACYGDDCPFVSTTFFDTLIFVFEIRVLLSLMAALAHCTKRGFKYTPALKICTLFFLPAFSLFWGSDTRPGTQAF